MLTKGSTYIIILIIFTVIACDDEQIQLVDNEEITQKTSELAKLKSKLDHATFNVFTKNFKNLDLDGRKSETNSTSHIATTLETCGEVTVKENENNTYTLIINFGDGCVETDGTYRQGVVAFTTDENSNTSIFKIGFQNYYEGDADDEIDLTISGIYQGDWAQHPSEQFNTLEKFTENLELNYKNGKQVIFTAKGQFLTADFGIVVTRHNFQGTNTQGDVYTSAIADPLIYNLNCTSSHTYIKGTEVYSFNGNSAAIDFGDGTCDNILTVQSDGTTVVIDLSKLN